MLEQLEEHHRWHSGDVRPDHRALDEVERVANRGDEELGVDVIIVVDLPDLCDQVHPFVADVIEAPNEG